LVGHAARHGRLEQMTKKIAVAETAVAVQRIDAIFDIERDISDKRAEERLRARRVTSPMSSRSWKPGYALNAPNPLAMPRSPIERRSCP
jgi:hypothetical protein